MFVTAMLLLNITPGPDMLYVIARSVGQGRAAGIASALGVGAGCFFHIFAVAVGVAELLRAVPVAYQAIRCGGAAGPDIFAGRGHQYSESEGGPFSFWRSCRSSSIHMVQDCGRG